MTEKFEEWGILELFGHGRIAGKVSEQQLGGVSLVRVDVPETPNYPGFTKMFGGGAIFSLTITNEESARAAVAAWAPRPMDQWDLNEILRKQKLLEGSKEDDVDEMIPGVCRVCGCTETTPCTTPYTGEPCHWIEPDLCSVCEGEVT